MKKLLSLSLLLLLIVSCFGLASCSDDEDTNGANGANTNLGVSTGTIGENPLQVYMEAAQNTSTVFFADNAGVINSINGAINNGSIAIDFNNPELLAMIDSDLDSVSAIAAKLFINRASGVYGANASVNYNGKNYDASAYISQSLIGVKDNGLLNVNGSYSANIDSIIASFPNTTLGKDLGVTSQMYNELKSMIEEYRKQFNSILTNAQISKDNIVNAALKALNPSVVEEKITIGSESIDCVVVTYKINTNTIKDVLVAVFNDPSLSAYVPANASSMVDEIVEEMASEFNPDLTIKLCLSKATNSFAKIDVSGKVEFTDYNESAASVSQEMYDSYYNTDAYYEYATFEDYYYAMTGEQLYYYSEETVSVPVSATVSVNKTDLVITGSSTIDGDSFGSTVSINKSTSGSDTKYSIKGSVSMGAMSVDIMTATVTHNQSNGNFSISASVDGRYFGNDIPSMLLDENDMLTATIFGTASGSSVTISKIQVGSFSLNIGLKLTFTPGEGAPMINGTDITTLTEDQAEDIIDAMEDSVLVEIFEEIF